MQLGKDESGTGYLFCDKDFQFAQDNVDSTINWEVGQT